MSGDMIAALVGVTAALFVAVRGLQSHGLPFEKKAVMVVAWIVIIAVVSFVMEGAHAHDLATLLDLEGVAVRSGQHCAHPLMQHYGVPATCRASLAFYNTHEEIDAFAAALSKVRRLLA